MKKIYMGKRTQLPEIQLHTYAVYSGDVLSTLIEKYPLLDKLLIETSNLATEKSKIGYYAALSDQLTKELGGTK